MANIGNGWSVIDVRTEGDTRVVYVRIPRDVATAIDGGCCCEYCKAHPEEIPQWDCLAVCDEYGDHSWTVHYPDPKVSGPEKERGRKARERRRKR